MRVAPCPTRAGGEPWLADPEPALKMTRWLDPTRRVPPQASGLPGWQPSGAGVAQMRFPLGVLSLALAPGD